MDPQDTETRSTPEQPLTRRELRARERAQTEAQQRILSATSRTATSPNRPIAASNPPAADARVETTPPVADQAAVPSRPEAPVSAPRTEAPVSAPRPEAPRTEAPRPETARRSARPTGEWPAPVPASSTRLAVKGAPVYEAEERVARGFYDRGPSPEGRRAATPPDSGQGTPVGTPPSSVVPATAPVTTTAAVVPETAPEDDASLSVLRRAEALRAAASESRPTGPTEAAVVEPEATIEAQPGSPEGRHRDAALGHHVGAALALAERDTEPAELAGPSIGEDAHPVTDTPLAHHPEESTVHEAVFASAEEVKAKPKRSRQFKALLTMGVALALIVGACFLGAAVLRPLLGMDKVADYPGPGSGQVVVTVKPGSAARAVAQDLQQQGVIADVDTFLKALSATNASIHPGDFTFKKQMKASDAAAILTDDGSKVVYFALSAGLRIGDSLDTIAQSAGLDRKELETLNSQPAQFGLPSQAKNLEGYLEPGEYKFPIGTSAKDILAKLVSTRLDELKQDGITDPAKQYEVLTVASIVQAEGGQADYGNVAGAIYNRLKPNDQTQGLIQSDATVTYGLSTKTVQLTDAQKADANNPYNTYVHQGLPPGPIGSPGSKAVAAAAHPTANDYLFWVTVNLDTGETKFSKTYAEHQTYVAQYQQWCTANPGKCQ